MIGEIFYKDERYSERAKWCNDNDCHIEEIQGDEKGRKFVIVKNPEIEQAELLRIMRQDECFSVVNRGNLWYHKLNREQLTELDEWYQAWLDAPQTKIVPEKPIWLK